MAPQAGVVKEFEDFIPENRAAQGSLSLTPKRRTGRLVSTESATQSRSPSISCYRRMQPQPCSSYGAKIGRYGYTTPDA